MGLRPGNFGGPRAVACRPSRFQLGQDVVENALQEYGGEGRQAFRNGLLGHLEHGNPEQRFALYQARQLADAADLPPDHRQYQRDHHRQGQNTGPQFQLPIGILLGQRGGVHETGEFFFELFWRRARWLMYPPLALNRAGMPDGTLFIFLGFCIRFAHTTYCTAVAT